MGLIPQCSVVHWCQHPPDRLSKRVCWWGGVCAGGGGVSVGGDRVYVSVGVCVCQ